MKKEKLSDDEKKRRAKESQRKWRKENPEKWKELQKKWRDKKRGGPPAPKKEKIAKAPRVKMTDEERAEKKKAYAKKWREANKEKVAESNKRWKRENLEKHLMSRAEWEVSNPDKVRAWKASAKKKQRLRKLQSVEGLRAELMKLAWFKETFETPRYPRRIANWAGVAIERFDCGSLAEMLRDQNTVLKAKRDVVELYWAERCGRGDKPTDRLVLGWNGWIRTPKALNRLASMFGLEPGDYTDLDWSIPDYPEARVVKNFMGHNLTRIRLGDKWRGWKIVDRELAEWLRRERLVLSAFVTDATWGVQLVGRDGKFVTNFSVEWGADLVIDRKDLVELVTWICDRSAGVPVDEQWGEEPGVAAEAAREDLQRVRGMLKA